MQAYVFKFFLWETGYWSSMDITHDRAGFYLCWGCLVWVPGVYTSPAMYLVRHPNQLQPAVAAALLLAGLVSIAVNYDVDRQRLQFRWAGAAPLERYVRFMRLTKYFSARVGVCGLVTLWTYSSCT